MKKHYVALLLGCFILTAAAGATAQQLPLSGEVMGSDHIGSPPEDWSALVRISFNGKDDWDETKPENYEFIVDKGAKVKLWFQSIGYVENDVSISNVGKTSEKPKVRRIVLIKYEALAKMEEGVEIAIDNNARYCRETGQVDEAMYNLKLMKEVLKTTPEAPAKIDKAQLNLKKIQQVELQRPVSTEQEKRWNDFDQVILIKRNPQSNFTGNSYQNVINVLKDAGAPHGARRDAADILYNPKIAVSADVRNDALKFFRQQALNPRSSLFLSSLYGLVMIGTENDKNMVIKGAIEAVPETEADYAAVLIRFFEDKSNPANVRLRAVESLKNFYLQPNDVRRIKNASAADTVVIKNAVTNIKAVNSTMQIVH